MFKKKKKKHKKHYATLGEVKAQQIKDVEIGSDFTIRKLETYRNPLYLRERVKAFFIAEDYKIKRKS